MHPADVELGRTVPVEPGTDVVVMGLKPRRSRFDDLDVVVRETTRLLAGRGVEASWIEFDYGGWPEAVNLLRERRPSRVILPWRQDSDLEILAGRLRQNHFSSLELFQPAPGGRPESGVQSHAVTRVRGYYRTRSLPLLTNSLWFPDLGRPGYGDIGL